MIRRMIGFYNSKNRIINDFVANEKYFTPGKYKFDKTFNYIYLKDDIIGKKASEMMNGGYLVLTYKGSYFKNTIKKIIIKIISRKLIISKNNGHNNAFNGVIFLPGANKKEAKIFDFQNEIVISIVNEKKVYKNKISNYNYFNEFYPMPKIIDKDDECLIIEELIDYKTNRDWIDNDFEQIIEDVFKRTINYFIDVFKKHNFISKSPSKLLVELPVGDKMIDYIWNSLSKELKTIGLPFMKLHGDLWTSNILIDKKDNAIKYIDFEHSGEFIFFYDIFFMMWTEFTTCGTVYYASEFMAGKYDSYFEKMFEIFDLEFNSRYRQDYFNIFILDQYKNKCLNSSTSEKKRESFFERYNKFVNLIK